MDETNRFKRINVKNAVQLKTLKHIISLNGQIIQKGRVDLENGMCLCRKCHTEEHKNDQSYFMMKSKESRCSA